MYSNCETLRDELSSALGHSANVNVIFKFLPHAFKHIGINGFQCCYDVILRKGMRLNKVHIPAQKESHGVRSMTQEVTSKVGDHRQQHGESIAVAIVCLGVLGHDGGSEGGLHPHDR